ncbi:hypothetical protein [Streptomyces sp. NPDC001820]|uniref:hypothetical protein n=1 Tax=Streptomyces sp. NPDC001820 TaxID=3364613 RepID=UPI0036814A75
MMHWLEVLAKAIVAMIAVNLVLVVVQQGQLHLIMFQRRMHRNLAAVPGSTMLVCREGYVALMRYDERTGTDTFLKVYSTNLMLTRSSLSWKGGYRSVAVLRRKLGRELVGRCVVFALVCVPVFAYAAWLALEVHWSAVFYLVTLALVMRVQLVITALHGTLLSFALLYAVHHTFYPVL